MRQFYLAILLCLLASSCTPTVDQRGYQIDSPSWKEVLVGTHTKDDVQRIMGSPSLTSPFENDTWYYHRKKTSTSAFFKPDVLEQEIVAITFDTNGRVAKVEHDDQSKTPEIEPNKKKTESPHTESTMMREIFSNFGRMNTKKGSDKRAPGS